MAASDLLCAAARNDAVLNLAFGEILERAGGELLLTRGRAVAGKLVEHTGELCRHENSEILVRRVPRDIGRNEYLHVKRSCSFYRARSRGRQPARPPVRDI